METGRVEKAEKEIEDMTADFAAVFAALKSVRGLPPDGRAFEEADRRSEEKKWL
jgi:hypothetical protein